jgi:hypothetical protein
MAQKRPISDSLKIVSNAFFTGLDVDWEAELMLQEGGGQGEACLQKLSYSASKAFSVSAWVSR